MKIFHDISKIYSDEKIIVFLKMITKSCIAPFYLGFFSSNLRLIDCTYNIFTLYSYCTISSIHFVQWYFQSISPDDHSQSKIAPTLSLNISWLEWVITNLPAMIKTWMYRLLVYVIPSIQHALKHRYDKFYI